MSVNNKVDPKEYDFVITKFREFFRSKGFLESATQNRPSILAACEDPKTVRKFQWGDVEYALPQTGQMWLEHDLLANPDAPGFYCITTSYRYEPNPIPGRHERIFQMFEFEFPGNVDDLREMQRELLEFFGFGKKDSFPSVSYEEMCAKYGVSELTAEHETLMQQDIGNVFFLEQFPERTSPFFNMKANPADPTHFQKIDCIMFGQETIGSAERSCDPVAMKEKFHSISNGEYSKLLFDKFGKERVEKELNDFLGHNFFSRVGAGVGIARCIRACKLAGLI